MPKTYLGRGRKTVQTHGLATLVAQPPKESASDRARGGRRVLARARGPEASGDPVAGSSATDVVVLLTHHLPSVLATLLEGKFLIEAEDGALGVRVGVASASPAAAEVGPAARKALLEQGRWTTSRGADRGLVDLDGVAGAASSHIGVLGDVWVWLDDMEVEQGHC